MTYTWSKYPDAKPNRSGYYYTYYFNNEMNDCFYKAKEMFPEPKGE